MERHGACFCAVVVNNRRHGNIGGHAGYGNHVAVILLDHGGQELLHGEEVGEGVDLEGAADRILGLVEDRHGVANGSIVDQDRGVAMGFADLSTDCGQVGGRRDIGFVEVNASFYILSVNL